MKLQLFGLFANAAHARNIEKYVQNAENGVLKSPAVQKADGKSDFSRIVTYLTAAKTDEGWKMHKIVESSRIDYALTQEDEVDIRQIAALHDAGMAHTKEQLAAAFRNFTEHKIKEGYSIEKPMELSIVRYDAQPRKVP